MSAIAIGSESSVTNPILHIYTLKNGVLGAPHSLGYQIFDISTEANKLTPLQVYPETAGAIASVDLEADALRVGHYVANWEVDAEYESTGRHEIRWYMTVEEGGVELITSDEFEVLVGASNKRGYVLVSDLRDEGFSSSVLSDARAFALIEKASKLFDRYTGQWFEPREVELSLDGVRGKTLRIGVPIIAINTITCDENGISLSDVSIYNRHVSKLQSHPDDRGDPRIDWKYSGGNWYAYPQGIVVNGVFGYTDVEDHLIGAHKGIGFVGKTPELVKQAIKLLVVRDLALLSDTEGRLEALNRGRLKSESTRDQSYTLGASRAEQTGDYGWTGDEAIDELIALFRAPTFIGIP